MRVSAGRCQGPEGWRREGMVRKGYGREVGNGALSRKKVEKKKSGEQRRASMSFKRGRCTRGLDHAMGREGRARGVRVSRRSTVLVRRSRRCDLIDTPRVTRRLDTTGQSVDNTVRFAVTGETRGGEAFTCDEMGHTQTRPAARVSPHTVVPSSPQRNPEPTMRCLGFKVPPLR